MMGCEISLSNDQQTKSVRRAQAPASSPLVPHFSMRRKKLEDIMVVSSSTPLRTSCTVEKSEIPTTGISKPTSLETMGTSIAAMTLLADPPKTLTQQVDLRNRPHCSIVPVPDSFACSQSSNESQAIGGKPKEQVSFDRTMGLQLRKGLCCPIEMPWKEVETR